MLLHLTLMNTTHKIHKHNFFKHNSHTLHETIYWKAFNKMAVCLKLHFRVLHSSISKTGFNEVTALKSLYFDLSGVPLCLQTIEIGVCIIGT